jgi:hypothetical protein
MPTLSTEAGAIVRRAVTDPREPPNPESLRRLVGFDPAAALNETLKSLQRQAIEVARVDFDRITHAAFKTASEAAAAIVQQTIQQTSRAVSEWLEDAKGAVPPNWQMLTWPQIWDAGELMGELGWSLVWAPTGTQVEQILNAATLEERKQILLRSEGEIIAILDDLLAKIQNDDFVEVANSAREALEVYRGGHFRAAQTLSAATLSTIVHDLLGHRHARDARRAFRRDFSPDAVGLRLYRLAVILDAASTALTGYDAVGSQRRQTFNRAETVHRVLPPQHSQVNSLTALMLVATLIFELQTFVALDQ